MSIVKNARWQPATLTESDLPDNAIPFVMTQSDKTRAAIVRCDIERMQRAFRCPEGLEVGEATWEEFQAAREAFRHAY